MYLQPDLSKFHLTQNETSSNNKSTYEVAAEGFLSWIMASSSGDIFPLSRCQHGVHTSGWPLWSVNRALCLTNEKLSPKYYWDSPGSLYNLIFLLSSKFLFHLRTYYFFVAQSWYLYLQHDKQKLFLTAFFIVWVKKWNKFLIRDLIRYSSSI